MNTRADTGGVPAIWIRPLGNTGNRALQYLVAEGIRQHVPEARIDNIRLMEWGIDAPAPEPPLAGGTRLGWSRFWIDVPGLGDCLRRAVIQTVFLDSFSYNIDHYPAREICRHLLGGTVDGTDAKGFGPNELVCSIRGAEVLENAHPDYIVLPPHYYRMLAERSGLDLVFFGQIGEDPYSNSLRQAFPDARFVTGHNAGYDFEVLRRSCNIAPSVSTFAWLAAWLSEATRIYLPVGGFYNPIQHPRTNFLPVGDPTFEYVLLPYSKAVNLRTDPEGFAAQQDLLATCARHASAAEVTDICERARLIWPNQPLLRGFDPEYYVNRYPDIAAGLANGSLNSALEQYIHDGFRQGREPLEFDANFYVCTYQDAAMGIAEGRYTGPLDHYLAIGRSKGYAPHK